MKFRKAASTSPKMELLSRRSSSNPISSLRRSRSVRASLKLVSKIRSHATLSVNSQPSLPLVSLNPEGVFKPQITTMEKEPEALKKYLKPEKVKGTIQRDEKSQNGVENTPPRQPLVRKQKINGTKTDGKTKDGEIYQSVTSAGYNLDYTVSHNPKELRENFEVSQDKDENTLKNYEELVDTSSVSTAKTEKLSFADRIRGRHKKNLTDLRTAEVKRSPKKKDNSVTKEQVKSPKSVNFFRRDKQPPIVHSKFTNNDFDVVNYPKNVKNPVPNTQYQILGEFHSYENPTFSLDSSTNSDISNGLSVIAEQECSIVDEELSSRTSEFQETLKDVCENSDSKSDVSDSSWKEIQQGNEVMPSIGGYLLKPSKPKTMDNIANFLSSRRGTSFRPKKPKSNNKKVAKEFKEIEVSPKSGHFLQTIEPRRRLSTSASSSSTL